MSHLSVRAVDIHIGARALVRDLNILAGPGALIAVLGPNGVGKTLTLHTLAALRAPARGSIEINGRATGEIPRVELARHVGLLMQGADDAFPTTVREAALLGCFPRLRAWQSESAAERTRAEESLALMHLQSAGERAAASLSGGERRRLGIATLLVQDPDILLLDEPLNHLDPLHEIAVLRLLGALADGGKVVMASMHDPTLAARSFDHCLLLHGDGRWAFGAVGDLLTTTRLAELYGVPFSEFRVEGRVRENLIAPAWPKREAAVSPVPLSRSA